MILSQYDTYRYFCCNGSNLMYNETSQTLSGIDKSFEIFLSSIASFEIVNIPS